jgi:hypothetical protein
MANSVTRRKHIFRCMVQVPELTKSGTSVLFEVHAEREKIGTIVLGRGSITWFGGKRQNGTRITWSKFLELMNRHWYA